MQTSNLNVLSARLSLLWVSFFCVGVTGVVQSATADDWITWTSTYTHDAFTGQRVDQYAVPVAPVAPARENFQRSGFRHFRSTLQAGQSMDNMHIVEQWGAPVVPYEEWRFPYRPFSVPYDAWGPQAPYGIINGNFGFGGGAGWGGRPTPLPGQMPSNDPSSNQFGPGSGFPGQGYPRPMLPGTGSNGFPLQPQYQNQPWFDGTYPSAPPLDPRSDAEFFNDPRRR